MFTKLNFTLESLRNTLLDKLKQKLPRLSVLNWYCNYCKCKLRFFFLLVCKYFSIMNFEKLSYTVNTFFYYIKTAAKIIHLNEKLI